MREHVKHQWNYSMNMTKENSDEAQVSFKNLSKKIKKNSRRQCSDLRLSRLNGRKMPKILNLIIETS